MGAKLSTWLGIAGAVLGLLGMGGLGGVYYYAGQQQVRDSIVHRDLGEVQDKLDRIEQGQGDLRSDLKDVARAACEANGLTFAECPL